MNLVTRITKALRLMAMRFAGSTRWGPSWGPWVSGRAGYDYTSKVGDGRGSSVVAACIAWVCRTFPEAPVQIVQMEPDGTETILHDHPLAALLARPNAFYSGELLWKATLSDLQATGNAYWIKVRHRAGRPVELWWTPQTLIEPKWPADGSVYISHYVYKPGGETFEVAVEDVVHFRDGLDPANIRKGLSPLASLLREIYTDEEAASYTANLLRNMGVPGVVISPGSDAGELHPDDAKQLKQDFQEKFTGDRRGEPLILSTKASIVPLSFSPSQMDMRTLRRVPEERISAVLGVPAIVAGLGAGLDRACVPAYARVQTPDGTKAIAEITEGMLVWSFKDGQIVPQRVSHKWAAGCDMVYEIRTSNRRVRATDNHPFMVRVPGNSDGAKAERHPGYEWRALCDLQVGDDIIVAKGYLDPGGATLPDAHKAELSSALGFAAIKGITAIGEEEVFDLTVEGGHSFFCENVLVSNTYANFAEARECAYESNIIPTQRLLAGDLKAQLLPDFGDTAQLRVKFDVSGVRVLQEDQSRIWTRADMAVRGGWMTIGRAKELIGEEPLPSDDVYLRGMAVMEVRPGEVYEPPAPAPESAPVEEEPLFEGASGAATKSLSPTRSGDLPSTRSGGQRWLRGVEVYGSKQHARVWAEFIQRVRAWVFGLTGPVQGLLRDQQAEVLAGLGAGSAAEPFDMAAWVDKFQRTVRPIIGTVVQEAGQEALDSIGIEQVFDIFESRVVEFLNGRAQRFATQVNETTWEALKQSLGEGIAGGEGIPELSARVLRVMGDRIASTPEAIARTEVVGASTGGTIEAWKQSDIVRGKMWLSALDSRVRDDHITAHGQTVGLDEDFEVGGAHGPGPGLMGDPAQDCNCRCCLISVLRGSQND